MRRLAARLAMACVALSPVLTHTALAQQADSRDTLEETLVRAEACRIHVGDSWEPIVNDAIFNLESFLIEQDAAISKVDLDVALIELLAEGKAMPSTYELRAYCQRVMSSGG